VAETPRGMVLSNLQFRPMMFADLPRIYEMEQRCHPFPWSEQSLADCLRMQYECWIAEQIGGSEGAAGNPVDPQQRVMIGFAITMMALDEAHLLNIVVDQSHQGQGYGAELLNFMQAHAIRQRAAFMLLEVRESNTRAQRLYKKEGFDLIGVRKAYYPNGQNSREAALVMKCPLIPLPTPEGGPQKSD